MSILDLLKKSEIIWREHLKKEWPLYIRTPVKITSDTDRDWEFSTNLKEIFAKIGVNNELEKKFEKIITKYWNGTPEELALDTLHYLLWHELYHQIEAPFSTKGIDNDQKRIHQSIRKGIIKPEPDLRPAEQLMKVMASQNGVKDFILDNRFYLDNEKKGYVRNDIIPIWDLLELKDSKKEANFFTITRLMYAYQYGPESVHKFFKKKARKKGYGIAEKALTELTNKSIKLNKEANQLIREVFRGDDRYEGITRLMSVLGPYVTNNMPQSKPIKGEASGSPMNVLQDLLDDMTPEEQESFLQGLSQDNVKPLEQLLSNQDSETASESSINEVRNLDVISLHEYYKRNHPMVTIINGKYSSESVVIGKQQYWHLKSSKVLTNEQLSRVNLQLINRLQRKTRLPWLIDLGNNTYRLNEYVLKERDKRDVTYAPEELDVPDIIDFYLDSSGSMFGFSAGNFSINDGSRWDLLCNVFYGFIDALIQAGKKVGKETRIRVHNFSDKQVDSKLISVNQFWNGDTDSLRVFFKPDNGYNYENLNITDYGNGSKHAYVVVTDGNLVINGRTERESSKMKSLASKSYNHVLLFEIGGTYGLGRAVRDDKNITYCQVHNKNEMLSKGLEVLLSK